MRRLSFLLLLSALPLFFPSAARAQGAAKTRHWRVMVIVPEQHLARPRIPDPAVETMLCKQLIDAGYKVIDQDRIKEMRYAAVMDRILKGGPTAGREAIQIGRSFGADLLITGEAFTEEIGRKTVQTDLGAVPSIQCRARVELKGIRMDTGEKFYADAIHRTGRGEPTEALSSKSCLTDAAEAISPGLLAKLGGLALGGSQRIELEVRGLSSVALASQLEILLARLPGVSEVAPGDYDARVFTTELTVSRSATRGLPARLETEPSLRRFKLSVQSKNGSKIIVNCR